LLMPPGMCICRFVRAAEATPRPWGSESAECQRAEDQDEVCCPDPCCFQESTNRRVCGSEGQSGTPKPECPSNCPASGKAGHFNLLEHQHLSVGFLVALMPLPFFMAPQQ